MIHAASGLIWEEWRRTRKLCGFSLVLLIGIATVPWYFARIGSWPLEVASEVNQFFSLGLLATFTIYLTLSQSTKNDIQAGIPKRRFLLPVRTFELVFWPLAYRLAIITALSALTAALAILLYGSQYSPLVVLSCLLAVAGMVHMLAWSARLVGKFVTSVGFFLLFFPGVPLLARYMDSGLLPSPWLELLLPAISFVATLIVATFTVSVIRSGGWSFLFSKTATSVVKTRAAMVPDRRHFLSKFHAQVWYEWRRVGQKMALLITCPTCALLLIPMALSKQSNAWTGLTTGWMILLSLCVPAGLWAFVRSDSKMRRGVSRFEHTRCVDDSLLAWAKLGSSAATLIVVFLAVTIFAYLGFLVIAFLKPGYAVELPPGLKPTFASASAQAALILAGSWIAYTRGGFVVVVAIALQIANALCMLIWPWGHEQLSSTSASMPVPLLLNLTLLVVVLICLTTFLLALKSQLIPWRTLIVLVVLWVIGAVIGTPLIREHGSNLPEAGIVLYFAWVAGLMLLALTPLATTSLKVHGLRHQW